MGKTISITPNSGINDGEPNIKLQGNDAFFAVNMNIASGLPPSGSASGVSSVLFEGSQGTLFSIEDNLSSGSIFSVSDITGLPLIEATASGDVKLAEYGQEVISYKPILISGGAPITTTDKLYNDNGTLKFSGNTILAGAAQTTVTSIYNSSLVIGHSASDANIDFGTDNRITFDIDGTSQMVLLDGTLRPTTDSDVDLGSSAKRWKDTYVDTITTTSDVNCSGEVRTSNIGWHDGDNAMTIADGGKVTFAAGFAVGSDAEGDMLYHNGTCYVRLAKGSDDHVLTMNGNVPNWEAAGGGGGGGSMTTVKSNGSQVGGADIVTLDFSSAFSASETPDTEINIDLATVSVANGGTNATSFADKAVLITQDTGTDTVSAAAMDANGELLIGGTSGPAVATLTQGSNMTITNGNGSITLAAAGAGISDQALKDNVEDLDINALDKVDELRSVEFDWNQIAFDEHDGKEGHDFGLIAQEVEQIFPELVSEWRGHKAVDYGKLTVILIKAVQELRQEVETLKSTSN